MMAGFPLSVFLTLVTGLLLQKGTLHALREASCNQDYNLKIGLCEYRGLKSVPQDLLPDLRELDLIGNLLKELRNGSFAMYPNVQVLLLGDNNISLIENGAFTPLKNLARLSIGGNHHLPPLKKSFFCSPKLSNLNAITCSFVSFASDVVESMTAGAKLTLSHNKLQTLNWTSSNHLGFVYLDNNMFRQISNYTFVMAPKVDRLDLSNNPIEFIESSVISSLRVKVLRLYCTHLAIPQMTHLLWGIRLSDYIMIFDMSFSKLNNIDPGLFAPLNGKNLDQVNLRSNGLKEIHYDVLSDLTGVSQLLFGSNEFQELEPRQFEGMSALRTLSIEECQIQSINSQMDTWNLSLTHLNLAQNMLTEIKSSYFQGLKTLQVLDLSGNSKLHVIANNTFANFQFFRELDLSNTWIYDLSSVNHLPFLESLILDSSSVPTKLLRPGNLGHETPSLVVLNLINNGLGLENMWNQKNEISSFYGLHNLSFLELSDNHPLSHLPSGFFRNLSSLQRLRLDDCFLVHLEIGVFADLKNLVLLSLQRNLLMVLLSGLFDNMISLKELLLDNNDLTCFGPSLFKYNPNIVYLDVSGNRLPGLNSTTSEYLPNLYMLDIAENPLICDCDLQWLPGWLKGSVQLLDSLGTTCLDNPHTLKPFRGKQLITFDPGNECGPDIILYSCLAMAGVVLILTIGMIYYQRWWIKYKLFLLKISFIGYDELQDGVHRRDFLYDLAIMHHEEDDDWVNEHLRPALVEHVPDFNRIVCGDGELMPGMYYLDAVHYATEKSFKTICIISRAALQEQWFLIKFRTFLNHVNDVGIEKMILLFVEDIAEDELPFLIRLFLSDHRPYLVWPNDERGQPYFWEELVKDLTINLRCNHLVPPNN